MEKPPNHLIEKCLEEMISKAKNDQVQNGFKKALEELRKYPLPLKSGRECSIIIGFGDKICSIVDDWLDKKKKNEEKVKASKNSHKEFRKNKLADFKETGKIEKTLENIDKAKLISQKTNNYEEIEILSSDSDEETNKDCIKNSNPIVVVNKRKCTTVTETNKEDNFNFSETLKDLSRVKESLNTSPVNFSETLEEFPDCIELTKKPCNKTPVKRPYEKCVETQDRSKAIKKSSPVPLVNFSEALEFPDCPELSQKTSKKTSVQYLAEKYNEREREISGRPITKKKSPVKLLDKPESTKSLSKISSAESSQEIARFFLLPNNIDIILIVDKQETCGGKTRPEDDETLSELSKSKILFEVRSLKVGDFAWVARCKLTKKELILPYIVERKTLDDLSSSIKDGRYHEQKFRLSQCGIKNVIYLIENLNSKSSYRGSIPLTSLLQAGSNCLIQDNFHVQYTKNHKESMRYLTSTTLELTKIYENKELMSCSKENLDSKNSSTGSVEYLMVFDSFNKAAAKHKNFTVQNLLTRQLIKINGLSTEKAAAIAKRYPTPRILAQAVKDGNENFLSDISIGPSKKIGPAISKIIYQLYSKFDLD